MPQQASSFLLTLFTVWLALSPTTTCSPFPSPPTSLAPMESRQDVCVSADNSNPHANDYPSFISGNLNGTTLIVPIPLTTARRVIPAEYGILEHTYRALLPSFPQDAYPMMAVGVHDHDIQFPVYGAHPADFSRAALEFPFVDILGDNYSSFRWAATMLLTAGNDVAISGSEGFGITVYPGTFDPPCDAYAYYTQDDSSNMTHYFQAATTTDVDAEGGRLVSLQTATTEGLQDPWGVAFLRNITNQPVFANDTAVCDNYQRLFNTSLTLPPNEPVPVRGRVEARIEPFADADVAGSQVWEDGVFGWRISTAFLEPPVAASCASLKGFSV